jgi:hypothetical protein
MANSNFVVHNGLTVGPLTIDAASGSITTTGNLNISGSVGVDSIGNGDSSVVITDFGPNSTVLITVDGTARANVNSSGLFVTGVLNTSGNILGQAATFSSVNIAGAVAATQADATALAIALGG